MRRATYTIAAGCHIEVDIFVNYLQNQTWGLGDMNQSQIMYTLSHSGGQMCVWGGWGCNSIYITHGTDVSPEWLPFSGRLYIKVMKFIVSLLL